MEIHLTHQETMAITVAIGEYLKQDTSFLLSLPLQTSEEILEGILIKLREAE